MIFDQSVLLPFIKTFWNFISLLCNKWNPIARKTIMRMQKQAIIEINANLKTSLNSSRLFSLTVDIWTDRRLRSLLSLTAHFIDNNLDFKTHVSKFKQAFLTTGHN
ncbi:sialate O-acetylesterase isoform X2 [Brachionus plicatilis]|uniref:Sialate O-acetylesterase isoform X2 n=1 Tax=Brachionus plicatilis TaxID=10195 RepID=A0A3M7QJE4_BRAPC|nr:sialate O-acetylesterase isoform X2 [Brachionus plicatilis]